MRIIVDLHLHSRYSMATSPKLDLGTLSQGAVQKGIQLLAAPDFTHPIWRREMREDAVETQEGSGIYSAYGSHFMLAVEVSAVWRQDQRTRRVHLLVTAPNFDAAERISRSLSKLQDLEADGRPTLTVSARDIFHIVRDADETCQIIPAHVFTPWYGLFGDKSGFESMEECFGDVSDQIFAVETGLSSDPEMHWTVPDSAVRAIVSFSDAHSSGSLGREMTVIEVGDLSYQHVIEALRERRVVETYEFHPQHGKYYLDGHRKCNVSMTPQQSLRADFLCPSCRRKMTLGVLNRASRLTASPRREAGMTPDGLLHDPEGEQPPFRRMIQLREIISHALGVGVNTKTVGAAQQKLLDHFQTELEVLLKSESEEIAAATGNAHIGDAIIAARKGNVVLEPGYDGRYGSAKPDTSVAQRLL